jgi:hypothetical protein
MGLLAYRGKVTDIIYFFSIYLFGCLSTYKGTRGTSNLSGRGCFMICSENGRLVPQSISSNTGYLPLIWLATLLHSIHGPHVGLVVGSIILMEVFSPATATTWGCPIALVHLSLVFRFNLILLVFFLEGGVFIRVSSRSSMILTFFFLSNKMGNWSGANILMVFFVLS